MDKLFQYLGKRAGKSVKKGKWFYKSILGSEEETIKAQFSLVMRWLKKLLINTNWLKIQLLRN